MYKLEDPSSEMRKCLDAIQQCFGDLQLKEVQTSRVFEEGIVVDGVTAFIRNSSDEEVRLDITTYSSCEEEHYSRVDKLIAGLREKGFKVDGGRCEVVLVRRC